MRKVFSNSSSHLDTTHERDRHAIFRRVKRLIWLHRYCSYSWCTIKSVRVWFVCEDQYPRPLSTSFAFPVS